MQKNQKTKLYLFIFILIATIIFAVLFPRLTLPFGFSYIVYLVTKPFKDKIIFGNRNQQILYFIVFLSCVAFSLLPVIAVMNNLDTDFSQIKNQFPEIEKKLQDKFFLVKVEAFERFGLKLNVDPVTYIVSKLEKFGAILLKQFPNYISSLFEWLLLVPLFLYFLFMESRGFVSRFMSAIPNSIFEKTYVLFSQFNAKFGEYIIAKFIEATILGTIVTTLLLILGFPYPFILGFVAGVTNILPYIGPVIGFIPAFFVALLSKDPNASMMAMTLVFVVANLIDMILVFPLLVSRIVNLHPIVVVVSIVIGSQLGGIIGMIVIIPFIAFIKLLFKEIYKDLSIKL